MKIKLGESALFATDYDAIQGKLRNREGVILRRLKDNVVILGFAEVERWSTFNKDSFTLVGYVLDAGDGSSLLKGTWYTGFRLTDFVPLNSSVTLENN